MTEPTIICPNCKTEIKLTESLAAPLIESTRKQYEDRLAAKDAEVSKREAAIRERQAALTKAQESIDDEVAAKLKTERPNIAAEEAKKARLALSNDLDQKAAELADLQEVIKQKDAKLTEAQKAQADLIRKQRELDDAKREIDLTIEKRVQESLGATREQAKKEAEDSLKLKVAEKEQTIVSMQRQIEDLKRRAEQGSQQLQGEVQELELETMLREKFPHDSIEPVAKGEHGGDALQRVIGPLGQRCGAILWESKRTKNWSDSWLAKLRDDQRAANAEIAIMVSQALPKDVETFDLIDGVWVTSYHCALQVAIALRQSLIELAAARAAGEGQQTKMELVYQYLTGPRFRHRVQAIVEKFSDMHDDLEKERKTMTRLWAKREQQIRGVIESTAGMYGERLAQPPGCLGVFQGRARPPAGRQDRLRRSAPPTPGANATRKPSANTASLSPATTPSASNSAEPLAAEPADLGRTPMVLVRAYRAPARHPRFPRDGPQPAGVVRIALRKLGLDESASA